MNYHKIHDQLIERARTRVYDSKIYHNHHIIPRHEDRSSTEMVPLTIKEHSLVHRLRWKMYGGSGNLVASILLTHSDYSICSAAGMAGGAQTKKNKSGIFSESWDRSAETKRRHDEGIIVPYLKNDSETAKEMGRLAVESGKGIHHPDYDHSQASKNLWASGKMDHVANLPHVIEAKILRGYHSYEAKTGIHNPEKRSEWASLGGKVPMWTNGFENKKCVEKPGEDWYNGATRYWNNGIIHKPSVYSPGLGWVKGKLKNIKKEKV